MIPVAHVDRVESLAFNDLQVTANAVVAEVIRQDALARSGKFGGTHILPSGPDEARLSVLVEEVGEVARELNEALIHKRLDYEALIAELIQVGACAVAWATAIEHRTQA